MVLLPALDFDKLRLELGGGRHELSNGRLLRFEAQTRVALLLSGDAIIRRVGAGRGKQGNHSTKQAG